MKKRGGTFVEVCVVVLIAASLLSIVLGYIESSKEKIEKNIDELSEMQETAYNKILSGEKIEVNTDKLEEYQNNISSAVNDFENLIDNINKEINNNE